MARGAVLLAWPALAAACSTVRVETPDGPVIARTMEVGGYAVGAETDHAWPYVVVTHPRNAQAGGAHSYCNGTLGWTSKYAHVAVDSDPSYITEAMNEVGLTVSGQTLQESVYQNEAVGADPSAPQLCWRDFPQWAVAMHKDIPDLVAGLKKVAVVWQGSSGRGNRLHWAIEDGVNTAVVIEYIKGQLMVHENTVGILTNDPPFDWHLRNLNNYVMIRPDQPQIPAGMQRQSEIGSVPKPVGHGHNLLGIPGSSTPPDRFVRMWYLASVSSQNHPARNISEGVTQASAVISTVKIPKGSVAMTPHDDNQWEFTQWTVIKAPVQRLFYFKGYGEDRWRVVKAGHLGTVNRSRTIAVFQGTIADAALDVTPGDV